MDLCYTWYDLCMSDYFTIKGSAYNNSLDFPNFDDPPHTIYPLYEIVSDVEEFCERMSFPVYDDGQCYNGVPVASIRHLNRKTHWSEMFSWPSNKGAVDWSYSQIFIFMFRNTAIFKNFLRFLVVILVIMTIGYLFNRHQMRLRDKAEEVSEVVIQQKMEKIRIR